MTWGWRRLHVSEAGREKWPGLVVYWRDGSGAAVVVCCGGMVVVVALAVAKEGMVLANRQAGIQTEIGRRTGR